MTHLILLALVTVTMGCGSDQIDQKAQNNDDDEVVVNNDSNSNNADFGPTNVEPVGDLVSDQETPNVCPQAVAEARVFGTSQYQRTLIARPLDTIELTGTNSMDQNGSVESYEWRIVQRPTGSIAQLAPDPMAPEATIFLDLPGIYIIELTVTDDQQLTSCNDDDTKQIVVRVNGGEDLHIQLVWDTPMDSDQNDAKGADVDLHYLHPQGTWDTAPYDVYWNNPTSDWGAPGSRGDPNLDINDTDGAGPENINHNDLSDGVYTVGVHYKDARGYGPSYATVRIYIRGVQVFEQREQELADSGAFWEVATITWPSEVVTPVNQVTTDFPIP